jgi:hypothetical protein
VHINRGLVFWGVALVTAGVVALAIQSGTIAGDTARQLWRFWPVVLIIIGIAVIAARTPLALVATIAAGLVVGGLAGTLVGGWPEGVAVGCAGDVDQSVSDSGSFSGNASVELRFNCGTLNVSMGGGSEWSVEAGYAGGAQPSISSSDSSLRVTADDDGAPFNFGDRRQSWDVTLPTDGDLDLTVDANASESHLDLAGASLIGLDVDANAGDFEIGLTGASVNGMELHANAGAIKISGDDGTRLDGSVSMNAGSLELCVPLSAGIAITIADENITFSHNLDERGLTRQGDTWRTDGDTAITLDVSGNAASFNLNPEDGCS